MRTLPLFLAAMLTAAPAQAGVRAIYVSPGAAQPLVVEVADNGDARIGEQGASDYGLLVNGQFYMVGGKPGEWTVARTSDLARAVDATVGPVFGDSLSRTGPARPAATVRLTPGAERNVGGRRGRAYAVAGLDHEKPAAAVEVVVSADPALRPVGQALEGFMNASLIPGAPLLGSGAAELVEETRAIFALGTPLSSEGRFTLQSAETAAIPAARVALPDQPDTYETLVTKMRALVPNKAAK